VAEKASLFHLEFFDNNLFLLSSSQAMVGKSLGTLKFSSSGRKTFKPE
jgi:hypothetical protein